MPLYELNAFLRLSADLHYQLVVKPTNWSSVLEIILQERHLRMPIEAIIIETMQYLDQVYGRKKRRLGAHAIIHPLRATALLARSMTEPYYLDLLAALLHDRFEDFNPPKTPADFDACIDEGLRSILKKLPGEEQWFLMERLHWLTKRNGESYYQYIGRMLAEASHTPEAVRVKLADRLDNTLDMRMDLQDTFDHVDFFEQLFKMMFLPNFKGHKSEHTHPVPSSMNGAERLYQLFKNIILVSLVRQKRAAEGDAVCHTLFEVLIKASIREAQRIAMHISAYHQTDINKLRELVIETMSYVQDGGIDAVTSPAIGKKLDGLMVQKFDDPDKRSRKKKLLELYEDKDLMVEASIAFIVIFYSFLNDPDYYVHGISETGIHPESTLR
jgi:hypothetical protein